MNPAKKLRKVVYFVSAGSVFVALGINITSYFVTRKMLEEGYSVSVIEQQFDDAYHYSNSLEQLVFSVAEPGRRLAVLLK